MNTQKGFVSGGILIAIIVGVAAVVGGGYYVMQNRARQTPTYQEQTNTPPATTQATTKPSAPQARVGPYIETPPERETDPISEDWLDIAIAHGATESVDITGWSVRSTNSGKSFTIGTVVPHGSTAPIRVVLTGDEGGAFIHTVGSPSKSYVGEGNEYHLYFGEPKIAWGKEHDTIQLVNPSGVVVDTHSY